MAPDSTVSLRGTVDGTHPDECTNRRNLTLAHWCVPVLVSHSLGRVIPDLAVAHRHNAVEKLIRPGEHQSQQTGRLYIAGTPVIVCRRQCCLHTIEVLSQPPTCPFSTRTPSPYSAASMTTATCGPPLWTAIPRDVICRPVCYPVAVVAVWAAVPRSS